MPRPKKSAAKTPITKTAFVRGFPDSTPAKEISAKAKAAGLTISPGYVYEIRSSAKRRAKKAGAKGGAVRGPKVKQVKRAARAVGRPKAVHTVEAEFRRLVLDLGLDRAKRLLADVEGKLSRLISGL